MTIPNPDTPIERAARDIAPLLHHNPLRLEDGSLIPAFSGPDARTIVLAVLTAIRTPDEGMLRAGVEPMREVDGAVAFAANHGFRLGWLDRGEEPPLTRAFTTMIDHLVASGEQ